MPINLKKMPSGAVSNLAPLQLLDVWAAFYKKQGYEIHQLDLGKPTNFAKIDATIIEKQFWEKAATLEKQRTQLINKLSNFNALETQLAHDDIEKQEVEEMCGREIAVSNIWKEAADRLIADSLNDFYELTMFKNTESYEIKPKNVIFTEGGTAGLNIFFNWIKKQHPHGQIIVQSPYYCLYDRACQPNDLYCIDVIKNREYRITPAALKEAFDDAKARGITISAVMFCNPNNPLGSVLSEMDMKGIVNVLRQQDCYVVWDEAYAEQVFDLSNPLYLTYVFDAIEKEIIPKKDLIDLLKRSLILRSSTKGFSMPGERFAALFGFDDTLIDVLRAEMTRIGEPSLSAKIGYATVIAGLKDIAYHEELKLMAVPLDDVKCSTIPPKKIHILKRENSEEFKPLPLYTCFSFDERMASKFHYQPQVELVQKKLNELNLQLKDLSYKPKGTFYIVGDFTQLLGRKILNPTILDEMKNKIGLSLDDDSLSTDEEIAYYLLLMCGIAFAPLSHFGSDPALGYLRILCSSGEKNINEVFEKIRILISNPNIFPLFGHLEHRTEQNNQPKALELIRVELFPNFSPPNEDFTRYSMLYWDDLYKKTKEASNCRDKFYEQLFDQIKLESKGELIEGIKHDLIQFMQKKLIQNPLQVAETTQDILDNIDEKTNTNSGMPSEIQAAIVSAVHYIYKYHKHISKQFPLEISDFNSEFSKIGEQDLVTIEKENPLLKTLASILQVGVNHKQNVENIFLDLCFERIFYSIVHNSPIVKNKNFNKNFYCQQFEEKITNSNKFPLINDMVEKNAAVGYGDLQGDFFNRVKISKALNLWYKGLMEFAPENVLFLGIKVEAVFDEIFDVYDPFAFSIETFSHFICQHKPKAYLFRCGEFALQYKLDKMRVLLKLSAKEESPPFFILDESLIERELGNENQPLNDASLLKIITEFPQLKSHIILVRSSVGIFSTENEKISLALTVNDMIMAKMIEVSLYTHTHSRRSLQFAYANAFYNFTQHILDPECRNLCYQFLRGWKKFCYLSNQIKLKGELNQRIVTPGPFSFPSQSPPLRQQAQQSPQLNPPQSPLLLHQKRRSSHPHHTKSPQPLLFDMGLENRMRKREETTNSVEISPPTKQRKTKTAFFSTE